MKTGILGGTFDPIHQGHLFLAAEAMHVFKLDRIFFVPSKKGPHKGPSAASPSQRYQMVYEAIKDNSAFTALDIELNRSGVSYSIDTIEALEAEYPEDDFYFITGADAILLIESWKRYKDVFKRVKFIAATRAGEKNDLLESEVRRFNRLYGAHIEILKLLDLEISSSDIRARVATGKPIAYLVPKKVEIMIKQYAFYQ